MRLFLLLPAALLLTSMEASAATEPSGPPGNSKKGLCMTTKGGKDWKARLEKLEVSWHYNWAAKLPGAAPDGVDFVPMIWGYWGNSAGFKGTMRRLHGDRQAGREQHLLGFNEPDKKNQANISVDRALKAWPYLQWTGLRLGSPATVNPENEWMKTFMRKAEAKGYRIDFVTVHWYGGPNADSLISRLKRVHQLYGKPIWITEFAVADWTAKNRADNKFSERQVQQFMKEVLPRLDELDFVERYAWFSGGPNHAALGPSSLWNKDGTLTPLGKLYKAHR